MSRAKEIRDYLASQDGPRSSAQIQAAVGLTPRIATGAIGSLCKMGALVKHGHRPATYSLGVAVTEPVKYATEAERMAARRANGLRHYYKRAAELGHAPRREKPRKPKVAKPKPVKFQPIAVPRMRLVASQPVKPAPVPAETVAEWMARTGGQPEVLALGQVSRPLQFIGFRAFNNPQRAAA